MVSVNMNCPLKPERHRKTSGECKTAERGRKWIVLEENFPSPEKRDERVMGCQEEKHQRKNTRSWGPPGSRPPELGYRYGSVSATYCHTNAV